MILLGYMGDNFSIESRGVRKRFLFYEIGDIFTQSTGVHVLFILDKDLIVYLIRV